MCYEWEQHKMKHRMIIKVNSAHTHKQKCNERWSWKCCLPFVRNKQIKCNIYNGICHENTRILERLPKKMAPHQIRAQLHPHKWCLIFLCRFLFGLNAHTHTQLMRIIYKCLKSLPRLTIKMIKAHTHTEIKRIYHHNNREKETT